MISNLGIVCYNIILMTYLGPLETLVGISCAALAYKHYSRGYSRLCSHIFKIRINMNSGIISNFYESLRGATVARAFSKELVFTDRQRNFIDRRSIFFIAEQRAAKWFETRMALVSQIIFFTAMCIAVRLRSTEDPVLLILLVSYTIK